MDPTTRWISVLGIAALCFGIGLFVLRVPVRTILYASRAQIMHFLSLRK